MPVVSAFFLAAALALAVIIGPQTRPWTWGPAMLALGMSVCAALPVLWRRVKFQADARLLTFAWLVVGWFTWRAGVSPVSELAYTDLLLLCGAVASFTSVQAISGHAAAERVLSWGIALLLAASAWVAGNQVIDPSFSPLFASRSSEEMVSGFASHYNEAANYFIGLGFLSAGAALFGRHSTPGRAILLLLALAGLAGVYFTKSRGGIFGAALGCGVMVAVTLIITNRRNLKWFSPALIALPVVGVTIWVFWMSGWAQRSGGNTVGLLDNDIRLYLVGIALSCIGLHPLAGGGSRSFGWECYRFFDSHIQRHAGARPDLVHNELMQSATDYGLTGATLLTGLLGVLALTTILYILFEDRPRETDGRDAWRLGAIAALVGMFVQSCFSFVFHVMPGVILLGICLGMLSRSEPDTSSRRTLAVRVMFTLAAIGCAMMLLPAAWKGTSVTRVLWPTWFSKQPKRSAASRIAALTEAIRIWPLAEFYEARAEISQNQALKQNRSLFFTEQADLAIADYLEAARLHPFEPSYPINRANLLSQIGRDAEAEAAYDSGIRLQGGLEPGFRGHFSLANHHSRKGLKRLDAGDREGALSSLEIAAQEVETACSMAHWVTKDMDEPRVAIHESLGTMRETTGDRDGALAAYDFAAKLPKGKRVHYRAASLIGKMAVEAWSQRQASKAMSLFIEARRRIGQAGGELPAGTTPSQQVEYLAYLDRSIAFLKGAKVQPAE